MEMPCPEAAELKALVHDSLPTERTDELLRHVGECAKCQDSMERASGTESFRIHRLTKSGLDSEGDSSCREFLEQMKRTITQCEDAPKKVAKGDELSFLAPSEDETHLGKLGSLEVVEVVGRGGMGLVLRAIDPELQRTVAVKVLSPALAASKAARERFIREARAAAAIHHENVLPIHAVDRSGQLPYFTMPLIQGKSLQERLDEQDAAMPAAQVADIASKIASGLAAAHDKGLIHRDIKPANILLDEGESRVWLADFGLARAMEEPSVTMPGTLVGTPQFMAPEQLDDEPPSKRTDLFSLGSVLYYMATGKPAFAAKSTASTIRKVIDAQPQSPAKANPNLPAWLSALIEKLLNKDPKRRPASAQEVVDTINKHSQQRESAMSRRWLLIAAAVLVVGLLLAMLLGPKDTKPFLLSSSGKAFMTLTDAVEAAQDEDTIEIAVARARLTKPINFGNKAITIQSSGEGTRATLDLSILTPDEGSHLPTIQTDSDLTLSNLILARENNRPSMPDDTQGSPLIHFMGEQLQIRDCRFELTEKNQVGIQSPVVVLTDASTCEISDSTLLHSSRGIWLLSRNEDNASNAPLQISLDRNVMIGANSLLTLDHRAPRHLELKMKGNVIAGKRVLAVMPDHAWADMHATAIDSNSFCFGNLRSSLFRTPAEEPFRRHLHWAGQGNTFASSAGVHARSVPVVKVLDMMRPLAWADQWDGWTDRISEKNQRIVKLAAPVNLPRNVLLSDIDASALIPEEVALPESAP